MAILIEKGHFCPINRPERICDNCIEKDGHIIPQCGIDQSGVDGDPCPVAKKNILKRMRKVDGDGEYVMSRSEDGTKLVLEWKNYIFMVDCGQET